jgi:hypothetical protein
VTPDLEIWNPLPLTVQVTPEVLDTQRKGPEVVECP